MREHFTIGLQNNNDLKSKDLFRLGGQRWRRMSFAEKMPYVEMANQVKQQTSQKQNGKNERQNKPVAGDPAKKDDNTKDQKRKEQVRLLNETFAIILIPTRLKL